jgi:hypothetical protein
LKTSAVLKTSGDAVYAVFAMCILLSTIDISEVVQTVRTHDFELLRLVWFLGLQVREARDVDRLARKLEDAAGAVTLKWTTSRSSPNKSTMDKLVSCSTVARLAKA